MGRSRILESQTPLLDTDCEPVDGYVDYKGCPPKRSKSGGWRSAPFILAGGALERFAYYGIESNLVNYLTGPLGESVATAAANVNTWIGIVSIVPVFGAFLADSFIGRYRSVIISSILYILGFALLTVSAIITPRCISTQQNSSGPGIKVQILFFISLYLVALAQGYNTCLQAFGADQFDERHLEESRAKSSFFNWWLFGWCTGGMAAHLILNYIQDNINWSISFGIPCLAMIVGLVLFILGNRTYRFPAGRGDDESPYRRITRRFSKATTRVLDIVAPASIIGENTNNHEFLKDVMPAADDDSTYKNETFSKTKAIKKVLRLLPIWSPCLSYTIAHAQLSTLFTKQATTVDKSIWKGLEIPAATLKIFVPLSLMLCITIYDRIFVPITRSITKYPSGITMLQRIGIGMAVSVLNMVIAALVEMKRLKTAQEFDLIDIPKATVPMSFWWLTPQYMLFGLANVFIQVGMQEFFYDQVPIELRSLGLSFYYGALGIGNFLSSFLVYVIDKSTSQNGKEGWFSDNLNRAHIDYFYWLLAGIGAIGLIPFVYLAKSYIYSEENDVQKCSQA